MNKRGCAASRYSYRFKNVDDNVQLPSDASRFPKSTYSRLRFAFLDAKRKNFETLAKGHELSATNRELLYQKLPIPNSIFGLPPLLDDYLRDSDAREEDAVVSLCLSELKQIHEILLGVLVISETILKIGSNGKGASFKNGVSSYIEIGRSLLSAGIWDVIRWQREAVLSSWGVRQSSLSSILTTPLDGTPVQNPLTKEIYPALFGRALTSELHAIGVLQQRNVTNSKLPSLCNDLIFQVAIKMPFKTLCRYRQTCQAADKFVEFNRWKFTNGTRPIPWTFTMEQEGMEVMSEVSPLAVDEERGLLIKENIYKKRSAAIRLYDPYAQLSACRLDTVFLNLNTFSFNDIIFPYFNNEALPLLQNFQLTCDKLCVDSERLEVPHNTVLAILQSILFYKLSFKSLTTCQSIGWWPITQCSELHVSNICDKPDKLSPYVREFSRVSLEMSHQDAHSLFLDFLDACRTDRSARGILKDLHFCVLYDQPIDETLIEGAVAALGVAPIWKGHLVKRTRFYGSPTNFYKIDIDGGVALMHSSIFQYSSRYDVVFLPNCGRETLLNVLGQWMFLHIPYDFSIHYDNFMTSIIDDSALDLLYHSYFG